MSSDTHAIVFSTVSRLAGNFASVKTRPHALSREKNRDKEISRSVGIFWWDVRLVISYSIIQCWGVIVNNLEANKSVINTALAARPPARIYAITRYIVALTSKDPCAARFTLNNHSIHCFMREHSLLPLQWPRSPKKSGYLRMARGGPSVPFHDPIPSASPFLHQLVNSVFRRQVAATRIHSVT